MSPSGSRVCSYRCSAGLFSCVLILWSVLNLWPSLSVPAARCGRGDRFSRTVVAGYAIAANPKGIAMSWGSPDSRA
jgi:hypothetical protein